MPGRPNILRTICLFLIAGLPSAESVAQPSGDRVLELQRVLRNGCGEWVTRDGIMGPRTLGAYGRCRERYGFPPANSPGQREDVEAFIQELWCRKLAVVLLHQLGYLPHRYELSDRELIEDAFAQACRERGIDPLSELSPENVERLYRWYMQHSPAGTLGAALQAHHLPFTGLELFFQAFKKEAQVRVFARRAGRNTPFVLLKVFPITGSPFTYPAGGDPDRAGPKTIEGDFRVPEGCYGLVWQNQWSDFYLGYLLSYPHEGDRIRRDFWRAGPRSGGAIVLHGEAATIGCIPVGNAAIEEIFLLLNKNGRADRGYARIHIFPCRFDVPENQRILDYYARARPELAPFWECLRLVYQHFEETRQLPEVGFDAETGYYMLR